MDNNSSMQNGFGDKLPPQNIDAEKSLLGALLIDKESINKVVDYLLPEDFYQRGHQVIYQAVISLFERRENIDLLSLSNKLREMKALDEVGGVGYLSSLANSVPSSAHIGTYGKIVQRKKTLRNLIDTAHHIISLGHKEDEDVETLLDEAEQRLFKVSQNTMTQSFASLTGGLDEAMTRILNGHDGAHRGLTVGHTRLDDLLGGFQKSDLIILAARPAVGKTAFAVDLALRAAKHKVPVGIFSLEMSIDQVVDRFIASEAGVSMWGLRTGKMSPDHMEAITMGIDRLKDMKIFIDDASSLNVLQMRAMARRLQSEHGLGMLIIDYLQLMGSKRSYDSPVQQVTEISRGLKGLAKELNIPIIALSQLNRAVESRDGHRPKLSDLRDSGSIEQDADIVMFIHREDKNNPQLAVEQGKANLAQLIIAKHRNGPTGEVDFRIDPDSLKFLEVDYSHASMQQDTGFL
jgi:replicative DNA helicase